MPRDPPLGLKASWSAEGCRGKRPTQGCSPQTYPHPTSGSLCGTRARPVLVSHCRGGVIKRAVLKSTHVLSLALLESYSTIFLLVSAHWTLCPPFPYEIHGRRARKGNVSGSEAPRHTVSFISHRKL